MNKMLRYIITILILFISNCFYSQLIDTNFTSLKLLTDEENVHHLRDFEKFHSSSKNKKLTKKDSVIILYSCLNVVQSGSLMISPSENWYQPSDLLRRLPENTKLISTGISLNERIMDSVDCHALCFKILTPLKLHDTVCLNWNILSYGGVFSFDAYLTDKLTVNLNNKKTNLYNWRKFKKIPSNNVTSINDYDIQNFEIKFIVTEDLIKSKWFVLKPKNSGWIWDVNSKPKQMEPKDTISCLFNITEIEFEIDTNWLNQKNKIIKQLNDISKNNLIFNIQIGKNSSIDENEDFECNNLKNELIKIGYEKIEIKSNLIGIRNENDYDKKCLLLVYHVPKE